MSSLKMTFSLASLVVCRDAGDGTRCPMTHDMTGYKVIRIRLM